MVDAEVYAVSAWSKAVRPSEQGLQSQHQCYRRNKS